MRTQGKKRLFVVVAALLCAVMCLGLEACNKDAGTPTPSPADPNKVTEITIDNGKDVAIELGKTHQIEYSVKPDTVVNKGVTFTSADPAIVKVDKNNGLVTALKSGGPIEIALKSNENPEITATVKVTVTDAEAKEENKFVIALDPNVYMEGEVWADDATSEVGDRVAVYLIKDGTKLSFTGKLDAKKVFRFHISEQEITEAGIYDVETIFTSNEAAKLSKVVFNDVAIRNYVLEEESWTNGIDGHLSAPSTISLKDQNWGHVFKKYKVNTTTKRYITVKAASVDDKWSLKLMAKELGTADLTIGEWAGNTEANRTQTIDIKSIDAFKDKTEDFDLILKIYTIGENAKNPVVVVDNVAVHGGLNHEIDAVAKDDYKSITSINVANQKLVMGKDVTLTPEIQPTDSSFKQLLWTSSNNDIVTVDALGKLHPVAVGDAKITVTNLSKTITETFDVNVRVAVTGIALRKSGEYVEKGTSLNLSEYLKFTPADATNKNVTYTIDEEKSAAGAADAVEISATGVVTTKTASEKVVIVITTEDNAKKAEFTLSIVDKLVMPQNLKITTPESTKLVLGKNLKLLTTFGNTPSDKKVVWESSNPKVATVDANGTVKPISNGTVVITAYANADDTVKDTIELTVETGYAQAFDPAGYTWANATFSGLQAGDVLTVTAYDSKGAASGTPVVVTLTKDNLTQVMLPLADFDLDGADVYSFKSSVKRANKDLEGYKFTGLSLMNEGGDILSLGNWETQDASFSIKDDKASLGKGNLNWGHARTTVTFNLQKYPYLLFDVESMPEENMAYTVKLSNVGETADPGLFGEIKHIGYYLVDLSKSSNSLLKGKVGDFDLTFRLFFVGSNGTAPIVFSKIRFLTAAEAAVSMGAAVTNATGMTLESDTMSLNIKDAQEKYGKITVASFAPEKTTFKGVKYEVADSTIVSVDASGKVTALKAGTTTITVKNIATPTVQATVAVTVKSEDVRYGMNIDATLHKSITLECSGVADGTDVRISVKEKTADTASTFTAKAKDGKAVFDISSMGAGKKDYIVISTDVVADSIYATKRVFHHDLSKGAQQGDASYSISLISDGNGTPTPVLTLKNGKYYNAGEGWGQVSLKLKNFNAEDYTYFELDIKSIAQGATSKINAVIRNASGSDEHLAVVGDKNSPGLIRFNCSAQIKAFAAKAKDRSLEFRSFVIGSGETKTVEFGYLSGYHVLHAEKIAE